MTSPRVLIPHPSPRFRRGAQGWEVVDPRSEDYGRAIEFQLDAEDWAAVEEAGGLPTLTQAQRDEGVRIARSYICEAEDHRLGLPVDRFERLTPKELRSLGFIEEDVSEALLSCARSHPPAESFGFFVNGVGALYEDVAGRSRTARNDHDGRRGAEAVSPFVRFVLAIWIRLPAANRRSRSPSQMAARVARHFSMRGRHPQWDD